MIAHIFMMMTFQILFFFSTDLNWVAKFLFLLFYFFRKYIKIRAKPSFS